MRVLPLLCCLALAGCAGAGHGVAPAGTAPTAAASPPPAAAMQAHASAKASAKAAAHASVNASAKDRTAAAKTDAADQKAENNDLPIEGPITREKINAMCWMKYEKGRRDLPLDKRADLVNQCVAEALKEYPVK